MDGYEVHFDELRICSSQLESIIEELQAQISDMKKTEEELLNDKLWYGPNKSQFTQGFIKYKEALDGLYNNAVEHHERLVEINNTYVKAED